jgi:hypothetical protein
VPTPRLERRIGLPPAGPGAAAKSHPVETGRAYAARSVELRLTHRALADELAGRWRALTWWEEELGSVWLLGAGYHRSGEAAPPTPS